MNPRGAAPRPALTTPRESAPQRTRWPESNRASEPGDKRGDCSRASPHARHPGGSRGPGQHAPSMRPWIPAFAGMTEFGFSVLGNQQRGSAVTSAEGGRHPGASRGPEQRAPSKRPWIPAFAGMTEFGFLFLGNHPRSSVVRSRRPQAAVQGNKRRASGSWTLFRLYDAVGVFATASRYAYPCRRLCTAAIFAQEMSS